MDARIRQLIFLLLLVPGIWAHGSSLQVDRLSGSNLYAIMGKTNGIRAQLVARKGTVPDLDVVQVVLNPYQNRYRGKKSNRVTMLLSRLKPEYRKEILQKVFPKDGFRSGAYRHMVERTGVESYWRLAEWFTGNGANYKKIKAANGRRSNNLKTGYWLKIPRELLLPEFLPDFEPEATVERPVEGEPESGSSVSEPDPAPDPVKPLKPVDLTQELTVHGTTVLTYGSDKDGDYAVYRLQRGEALYSSVVVRFTGRLEAEAVHELVDVIVKRNRIRDVTDMPVGYPVKIPLELLLPEYLPRSSQAYQEYAAELKEAEAAALAEGIVKSRELDGVVVILDAGHGGRDTGANHNKAWEDDYVYDIMCRIKRIMEKETRGKVIPTIMDKSSKYEVFDRKSLKRDSDEYLLTTPNYSLNARSVTTTGVHLRWYLANAHYEKLQKSGVPRSKIVFLSLHADALYYKVNGAMAYIPSAARDVFRSSIHLTNSRYRKYAEYRQKPKYTFSRKEVRRAEGVSRNFAKILVDQLKRDNLPVHDQKPIRTHIYRSRRSRPFVPAVVRYNKAMVRCLIEVGNLKNKGDAANIRDPKFREKFARSVVNSLIRFYNGS